MSKIRALNEDESSQDSSSEESGNCRKQTKEAQEGAAIELYTQSLSLISSSQIKEAAETLENVLLLPYLNEKDSKKCSPLQSQIKLGCLKNLSSIYYSLAPDDQSAIRILKEIVLIDSTNVNIWYKLGIVCKKTFDYELAVYAFVQGLKCSPNHWACLENLVTLLYVQDDYENCLKYCALGLSKDLGFLRGLVYRDHIFERQPYLKEQIKNKFPHWGQLEITAGKLYDENWKLKFLDEARTLLKVQRDYNSSIISNARAQQSEVITCPFKLSSYTFVELCKIVGAFHAMLKSNGSYLHPISLSNEISPDPVRVEPVSNSELNILKSEQIQPGSDSRRCSTDEKETQSSTNENESGMETTDTTSNLEMDDRSRDDAKLERVGKDSVPFSPQRKKKAKRDVKWWQIEGKRRSQRVRGILSAPSQDDSKPETTFGDRLKQFFPSVFASDENDSPAEGSTKNGQSQTNEKSLELLYFGTAKETADVQEFITLHRKTNIMNLIEKLAITLSLKTNLEWSGDLILEFSKLYRLYRLHVEWPNQCCDSESTEKMKFNVIMGLTLLEFQLEQTLDSNVDSLKNDPLFISELFQIIQISKVLGDLDFEIRLDWFLSKYFLRCAKLGKINYDSALYYLHEANVCIDMKNCDTTEEFVLRIPTSKENIISKEEVTKKLNQLEKLENMDKIHELYDAKKYDDLLDILDFCLKKSEDIEPCDLMNRFYFADAHFHKNNFVESLQQCLNIVNRGGKHSISDGVLPKCLLLMKKTVLITEIEIPFQLIRQIMKSLISLVISYEYKLCINPTIAVSPWCILHCLLLRIEHKDENDIGSKVYQDEVAPNSVLLLQFAHEILGRMRKCGINKGRLLTYTITALVSLTGIPAYSDFQEFNHCIEQAIFCAYHHPSKISKLRHLTDHGCPGIELDWAKCLPLYQYYKPSILPEFDSYDSILVEDEALYQRILGLMPEEIKPTEKFQQIQSYLKGETEKIPETKVEFPENYTDIFYLIADHHFKTKEWNKALEYYSWDLTIHEYRFDSWAAMALGITGMINAQLTSCENFDVNEILSNASTGIRCFTNALSIHPDNSKLHIEYGSFVYSMHSLCSRLLKEGSERLSMEEFRLLETKKNEYMKIVVKCFEPTERNSGKEAMTDEEQQDDIWIHHYMWGKILEKLHPKDPAKYLEQYELAGKILNEQGAIYPAKINFYYPQELSIEALEIYYRIHASILGYIEKHKYSSFMEETLSGFLSRAAESPFMQAKYKRLENAAESKRRKHNVNIDKELSEVRMVLENILEQVEEHLQKNVTNSRSSVNSSSASSSSEDSNSASSEDSSKKTPQSFSLSMFQQKLKEKELRDQELAEAAKQKVQITDKSLSSNEELKIKNGNECGVFQGIKYGNLIWQCVNAMEECISRFPAHHKSYFKISYTYFQFSKENSTISISRDWLLGSELGEKKKISGLFADRKPTNFFNGVWRNPVQDIDRPGSFPYHMSKTIQNLIDVLNQLNDHEMLAEIGIQLTKIPEPDKKYLYDFEREEFAKQAFTDCVAAAKRQLSSADSIPNVGRAIFASLVKIRKVDLPEAQQSMNLVLLDAFKLWIRSMGGDDTGANIQQAFRHFQQLTWESKAVSIGKTSGNNSISSIRPVRRANADLHRRVVQNNYNHADRGAQNAEDHNFTRMNAVKPNSRATQSTSNSSRKDFHNSNKAAIQRNLDKGIKSSLGNSALVYDEISRKIPDMSPTDIWMKLYGTSIIPPNLFSTIPESTSTVQKHQLENKLIDKNNESNTKKNVQRKHSSTPTSTSTKYLINSEQSLVNKTWKGIVQKNVADILTNAVTRPSISPNQNKGCLPMVRKPPKLTVMPGLKQDSRILSSNNGPDKFGNRRIQQPKSQEVSPAALRTPSGSIPMSSVSTLNTSPYKAQSTIVSRPGLDLGYNPAELQITRVERSVTPPAAHSSNRTSYSNNATSPEIIDLTTSKSPIASEKQSTSSVVVRQIVHPENSCGKPRKRPSTDVIPIYSTSDVQKPFILPPKKQHVMRPVTEPQVSKKPRSPPLIIID